jgi:hypothetical protein
VNPGTLNLSSYNYRLILAHFQEKTSKTDGTFPSKVRLTLHSMKRIMRAEDDMGMANMVEKGVRIPK